MRFRGRKEICCRDRVEEILSNFSNYSKNGASILSFRESSCKCRVPVPEGTIAERVEDMISCSEKDNSLQKTHISST
jgi:hypothetical protein